MLQIQEALKVQGHAALQKTRALKGDFGGFVVSGLFGGAYIGVGVVLMLSAAGPFATAGDPLAKLVSGVVFSAALIIVVFAGAELITSTMMTSLQGLYMRATGFGPAGMVLFVTFVANFFGSLIFSALVAASGVLKVNVAAGEMLVSLLAVKADASAAELLVRGILCNVLVTLAVWMSLRVENPVAKIGVIVAAITAFVASGFEHVVANMTVYWLGVFASDPNATALFFSGNMLWVGLGNLIGGGFIVGFSYWVIGGRPRLAVVESLV